MTRWKTPRRLEADEQEALFTWAGHMEIRWPEITLLHAIPNGGSRHPIEAANLKAQGVKAGVPDICLPVARGEFHGLYIELKRDKKATISEDQLRWIAALVKEGHKAVRCDGMNQAADVITEYLNQPRKE